MAVGVKVVRGDHFTVTLICRQLCSRRHGYPNCTSAEKCIVGQCVILVGVPRQPDPPCLGDACLPHKPRKDPRLGHHVGRDLLMPGFGPNAYALLIGGELSILANFFSKY